MPRKLALSRGVPAPLPPLDPFAIAGAFDAMAALGPTRAPESCVTEAPSIAPGHVVLIGKDLQRRVRIKIEVEEGDVTPWLLDLIRLWLGWQHSAVEPEPRPTLHVLPGGVA